MNISVIIPVSSNISHIKSLDFLQQVSYPKEKIEILVVEGNAPAWQRNLAAEKAGGELLCFFDDDLMYEKDFFDRALAHFQDPSVAAVGGPALIDPEGNFFQQMVGTAFASMFGTWDVRYRHKAIGQEVKRADETMLILCNFLIRKEIFIAEGGFNKKFFPNEENEFINRLAAGQHKILYDPNLRVWRKYRDNLWDFCRGVARDGRGRVDHYFFAPDFFKVKFFIPMLFDLYLAGLCFIYDHWYLLPLVFYFGLSVLASTIEAAAKRSLRALFYLPFLFMAMHLLYGIGTGYGLIKNIFRLRSLNIQEPRLRLHKQFGAPWPQTT